MIGAATGILDLLLTLLGLNLRYLGHPRVVETVTAVLVLLVTAGAW